MRLLFIKIPALARVFGSHSFAAKFTTLFKLWYFLLSRKLFGLERDFEITGTIFSKEIKFFLRYPMDIAVLSEVFLIGEYDWIPKGLNPDVIIDLGAHFGDTAVYYHARFPNAKIIAVEPSPENFLRLKQHVEPFKQIIPVNAAIGDFDGKINLNLVASSFGHSTLDRGDVKGVVEVAQLTLGTLFKKYNVSRADIIKFDIEGAEFDLLKGIDLSDFAQSYIGELHFDLSETVSLEGCKKWWKNYDFELTKISEKRYILKLET